MLFAIGDSSCQEADPKSGIYYWPCPRSEPLSEAVGAQIFCKLDDRGEPEVLKKGGRRNALLLLGEERGEDSVW